jgi:hypothetical protein
MAVFYVLPPRAQVGRHFQEFLASMFPGQSWLASDWPDLAEALAQAAEGQPSVYVVFADDLDETIGVDASIERDFGAEAGDDVVVVSPQRTFPMVLADRHRIVGQRVRAA